MRRSYCGDLRRVVSAGLCCLGTALLFGCGGHGAGVGAINLGTDVVVTDVDADTRADVLAITLRFGGDEPWQGTLTVRRQTAPGTLASAETYGVGCYPWSMSVADIDGDQLVDVVVTDVGYTRCSDPTAGNSLYVLRQDPSRPGHFLPAEKLAGEVHSYQAVVADLNGDGAPDIAFGRRVSGAPRLVVLYQDPQQRGRFAAPVELDAPGGISEMAAGDIDGDGQADLFFVAYGPSTGYVPNNWLAVALQLTGGQLSPATLLSSQTGLNVQRLAIVDLDGDGRADLLAHMTPSSFEYGTFLRAIRQGPTTLAWSAPTDTDLANILGVDGTAFGDLNHDGRPDAVLAGSWPESGGPLSAPNIRSRVNLLFGRGDGSFRFAGGIDVGLQPTAVAIGDLDGDDHNDIVLYDGDTLWWMRQSAAQPGSFEAPGPLP